ncbi:MAG: hypothetical protein NTZ74_06025 [Chloroflexi bacterium]|nr:hypothetical protein [Chloroflexota bacterium]
MVKHNYLKKIFIPFVIIFLIITPLLSACNILKQVGFQQTEEIYPEAEIVFQVRLPAEEPANTQIILEILDDVTGIYFNPTRYEMTKQDDLNYFIRIPLIIGSEIKYRFLRKGEKTEIEYTSQNKQIRFRSLRVNGPNIIKDSIAGWMGQQYNGAVGRIRGQLIDESNNAPIPNLLVIAGGMQTVTSSDGTFILEALPVWTHNVVILSMDGAYETFQQGAVVATESTTPIFITLKKRATAEIFFTVQTPRGFNSDLPLRFASNLSSLGNPYSDLASGSGLISSTLPILEKISDNMYSIRLNIPIGTYLKYKFTLGDGFWNSELDQSGNFVIRELIIPSNNATIKKVIQTFHSPNFGQIVLNVKTPLNTPVGDKISIQFDPFGWMEPLQMVKNGENSWSYTLYSPLHLLGNLNFRFCRNDQCNIASAIATENKSVLGGHDPQILDLSVTNWDNYFPYSGTSEFDSTGNLILPRTDFITGFELSPDLPVSWNQYIDQGLLTISNTGSNWLIISPTWTATSTNPPLFEPIPGSDLLWDENQNLITRVVLAGLEPVLYPQMSFPSSSNDFWKESERNEGWWQSFFDRYQRFILNYADLAAIMNVEAFVIGDPAMGPAMSGGKLSDGSQSNAPENSDGQWIQLIQDIRSRYSGPIIGVISLPSTNSQYPGWLSSVDAIYVLFSPSLDISDGSFENSFNAKIDEILLPLYNHFSKPILIGIDTLSVSSANNGCISTNDSCDHSHLFNYEGDPVDLELQSKIYNAAITSSASRSWISGFISKGFNPIVANHDKTSSIYGKPAYDVLWFWYHFILNIAP